MTKAEQDRVMDSGAAPVADGGQGWVRAAREMVDDLQQRAPLIYWTDFLLSVAAAWLLAAIWFAMPGRSAAGFLALLGSSILFFRAGTFIHEIIHFRDGEMRWFPRAWNLFMGIPLLMPWIMYRNHIEHHNVRYFGTPEDGEYLPLAAAPAREIIIYLVQAPLLPVLMVLRFGVAGPVSWLHRGLREYVLTAASAGVSNPYYRRRFPAADEAHLRIVEVLCLIWLLVLAAFLVRGSMSLMLLFKAYLLLGLTLGLNLVRNLGAHGYGNRGERMSHAEQFADSINVTGQTWLTVFLFPVGLRYHALHHLFPALPYHNLGKAHARLCAQLPADSPYHAGNRRSYFASVAALWRSARHTPPADSAVSIWRMRNAGA
jgi:fatty acid desaturase